MDSSAHDRGAFLTALTTEHFKLQERVRQTITENLGSLDDLSRQPVSDLVALALIVQGDSTAGDFRLFALVILPALFFLGTVTLARGVETGT